MFDFIKKIRSENFQFVLFCIMIQLWSKREEGFIGVHFMCLLCLFSEYELQPLFFSPILQNIFNSKVYNNSLIFFKV